MRTAETLGGLHRPSQFIEQFLLVANRGYAPSAFRVIASAYFNDANTFA